jgi:hypothetical protein
VDEWEKLTKGKVFVSDLGESRQVEIGGKPTLLGRYAVWAPTSRSSKHQVIEVSDDFDALTRKYKISEGLVLTLNRQMEHDNA